MHRRLPRAARALLAFSIVCSVAAACASSDPPAVRSPIGDGYVGRRGAPRVAIAGDSITELARAVVIPALVPRYRVRVDAFTGRTIAEVTPAIRDQVETHPDVAVVNLGTNDMDRDHASWRADLDRMLHLVAGVPCVEVFTVYDGRHPPADANVGTQINARLATRAAAGSVHLIDWNSAVRGDPGLVVADGIHPSAAGQRWIAEAIRDALAADC